MPTMISAAIKDRDFFSEDTLTAFELEEIKRIEVARENAKTSKDDEALPEWSAENEENNGPNSAKEAFEEAMNDIDDVLKKMENPKSLIYVSESMRALRLFGVNMFNKAEPINRLDLTDKMAKTLEKKKKALEIKLVHTIKNKDLYSPAMQGFMEYLIFLINQSLADHMKNLDIDTISFAIPTNDENNKGEKGATEASPTEASNEAGKTTEPTKDGSNNVDDSGGADESKTTDDDGGKKPAAKPSKKSSRNESADGEKEDSSNEDENYQPQDDEDEDAASNDDGSAYENDRGVPFRFPPSGDGKGVLISFELTRAMAIWIQYLKNRKTRRNFGWDKEVMHILMDRVYMYDSNFCSFDNLFPGIMQDLDRREDFSAKPNKSVEDITLGVYDGISVVFFLIYICMTEWIDGIKHTGWEMLDHFFHDKIAATKTTKAKHLYQSAQVLYGVLMTDGCDPDLVSRTFDDGNQSMLLTFSVSIENA